jgi:hypothetical protein
MEEKDKTRITAAEMKYETHDENAFGWIVDDMNTAWDRISKSDATSETQILKPIRNYKPHS